MGALSYSRGASACGVHAKAAGGVLGAAWAEESSPLGPTRVGPRAPCLHKVRAGGPARRTLGRALDGVQNVLDRPRDSASGPDAVPYPALQTGCGVGAAAIFDAIGARRDVPLRVEGCRRNAAECGQRGLDPMVTSRAVRPLLAKPREASFSAATSRTMRGILDLTLERVGLLVVGQRAGARRATRPAHRRPASVDRCPGRAGWGEARRVRARFVGGRFRLSAFLR